MALRRLLLLAICLAFLLTAVRALKCNTELKHNCTKEGVAVCKKIGKSTPKSSTECGSGVSLCSSTSLNFSFEAQKLFFVVKAAGCAPKEAKGSEFKNHGCFMDEERFNVLDPAMAKIVKDIKSVGNVTANHKVCICKEDLCNGSSSVNSAVSISVIISSAVISLMLFT